MLPALILAFIVGSPTPPPPWTATEWFAQIERTGLTVSLLREWRENNPRQIVMPVQKRHISYSAEQWRLLVEKYFQPKDVQTAMTVLQCESGGNPDAKNRHSSASGLFQHLGRYWTERSAKAGWGGADIFDPEANIAVAAWLKSVTGWGSWTCYG